MRAAPPELAALAARGLHVWREVEESIGLRNPNCYDRAARLLRSLAGLAADRGTQSDFARRREALRSRHDGKQRFIEWIEDL